MAALSFALPSGAGQAALDFSAAPAKPIFTFCFVGCPGCAAADPESGHTAAVGGAEAASRDLLLML